MAQGPVSLVGCLEPALACPQMTPTWTSHPARVACYSRPTYADINQTATSNLGQLQAPGVYLSNVGDANLAVSALFENVNVPGPSDQLLLYVGTSATDVVRAGFHEQNVYLLVENQGNGDQRPFPKRLQRLYAWGQRGLDVQQDERSLEPRLE